MLKRLVFGTPFSKADLKAREPLIMADFLRPLPGRHNPTQSMQNQITRRLSNWLGPGVGAVFDGTPRIALWDEEDEDSLPAREIYALHDLDPSVAGWVRLYDAEPPADVIDLMAARLKGRIVIGFELSPYLTRLCERLGQPYLSIAIHPLRFLKDYVFMVHSNFAGPVRLARFAIPAEDLRFAAQLCAADLGGRAGAGLQPGAAVLFGQVDVDAALIGARGLVSLQDHAPQIARLSADHDTVYFKPHPYQQNIGRQLRFLARFPNIRAIDDNPYRLLAAPEIDRVAALTSSVLTEAAFFGKPVTALSPIWRDRQAEPAYGLDLLSPQFWRQAISDDPAPDLARPALTGLVSTSIRSLLGVSWDRQDTPPSGVRLQVGQPLEMGRAAPGDAACQAVGQSAGWYAPADDHRWMGAGPSALSLRLPTGLTQRPRLILSLSAMASREAPVTCQIRVGDRVLCEHRFDSHTRRTLGVDLPATALSALGDLRLEIHCDRANAPARILGLPDQRPLALALYSVTAVLPEPALCLPLGETVATSDMAGTDCFGGFGWYPPEEIGIWVNGRKARLHITAPDAPETDFELVLCNVRALLSDLLDSNTLVVRIGETVRHIHRFCAGEPGDLQLGGVDITIPLPRSLLAGQVRVPVDLDLVACHSPRLAGLSEDDRDLGVAIGGFRLQSAIPALAAAPQDHVACLFGPFNIRTGLAVMAQNTQGALLTAMAGPGAPALGLKGPRAVNLNASAHLEDPTGLVDPTAGGAGINVFFGDVTRIAQLVQSEGRDILTGRHTVCYGAWELETLPTYLADTRHIDEYWALSHFIADAARARMDVPVHAFPLPVDLHFPARLPTRDHFGIPDEAFAFLFTFSVDSTMARKNPGAVFDAFQMAFPRADTPVALVIKSMMRQASPENRAAYADFAARAARDPRVILIEETLGRDDNAALYLNSDAYVSLHRAEGFGLTMAEAMGYGLPTIGTGYSGNLDFMRDGNACLVDYARVRMDPTAYHNQTGFWAEPDVADAARHMVRVHEDVRFRDRIARAGQETILTEFSRATVGRQLLARLAQIHAGRR